MTAEVQSAGAATSFVAPGTLVHNRFHIEQAMDSNSMFTSYKARDAQTDGPALVLIVTAPVSDAALAAASVAQGIDHKNVARLLAVGKHESLPFLAYELHDGHTLQQLLERKQATGAGGFHTKGALNIVSHLVAGLEAAHSGTIHGCLGLDTVIVNKAGRVVIVGLGLGAMLPELAKAGVLPGWPTVAPEVRTGQPPTASSDVYALGALGYHILVGAPALPGCKRPSEAVPGLGADADRLVGQSMSATPAQRPASASAFGEAFRAAVVSGRPSAEQPAVNQAGPATTAAVRSQAKRPSLAQAIAAAPVDAEAAVSGGAMSAALVAALADTEERFLINMGNLDYGPFSLQDVVDKIHSGEVRRGHTIIDKDTGNRQNVEDNPLLHDLVEQAQLRRDEERRAAAEVAHASQEKRRGFALYGFIIAGVVALGGGAYFLVSKLSADNSGDAKAEVAALEQGSLKVKINPIKVDKKSRKGSGRKGGKGAGGVAGGWDDSLSMDMGDEGGGGSERLDDSQINPVIQRHGGSLGRCLSKTGSRYADIDFIILGDGRVSQVRVNGQTSGALTNCLRGAMQKMKFPSFNGPRTKANFNMSL